MYLLKNADAYLPTPSGRCDILVGGGQILRIELGHRDPGAILRGDRREWSRRRAGTHRRPRPHHRRRGRGRLRHAHAGAGHLGRHRGRHHDRGRVSRHRWRDAQPGGAPGQGTRPRGGGAHLVHLHGPLQHSDPYAHREHRTRPALHRQGHRRRRGGGVRPPFDAADLR